ncbi:hypothetical protein NEF87_001178 [Candidatus Lokiarchaeum ossiferum]|uniref:Uncharacterized protein n=1 Tax=Candidatus Lokiarchaeum ossiferum TaxID=2951803 RepID=A0ABY6HN07_9ARCH|nr:hypothetical protein NEF87_001178 [Candidatus Lokiarchaeum sp. B-35]
MQSKWGVFIKKKIEEKPIYHNLKCENSRFNCDWNGDIEWILYLKRFMIEKFEWVHQIDCLNFEVLKGVETTIDV